MHTINVFFFSERVYKNYLNVIIELWSNPGLHLHLVILQMLLSKVTYIGNTLILKRQTGRVSAHNIKSQALFK